MLIFNILSYYYAKISRQLTIYSLNAHYIVKTSYMLVTIKITDGLIFDILVIDRRQQFCFFIF